MCIRCAHIAARLASPFLLRCPQCRRLRAPHSWGSSWCQPCWIRRQGSYAHCNGCGRYKLLRVKSCRLCSACYSDKNAAYALRRYVAQYTCPFAFNRELFDRLIARVDWTHVRERQNRRLHHLGKFLQQHEIAAPLSWEQLESVMPSLPRARRNIPKLIRMALLDIGHLAAERGEIEPYDDYAERRAARAPIAQASREIQPVLSAFADWLSSRQAKPSAIETHMRALAKFWRWCFERTITRPREVGAPLITAYFLGLHWQWQCEHCGAISYCSNESEKPPKQCSECRRSRTSRRVKRFAQNTVRRIRASLFTFFDWARLARRVMLNPVQCKVAAPEPKIQHYAPEILRKIGRFIVAPDSDPTAALLLYFIVFHLTTVKEMRYLRLPAVISLATKEASARLLSTSAVALPKRQPSLGIMHPGRPGGQISFHRAAQPWLRPLLVRVEAERASIIGARGKSRYVFVVARGALRDVPVSPVWIWQRVTHSTRLLFGIACNPSTLRKTAAIYFVDRVGAGVLNQMGWEAQQAFAYTWMAREMLDPSDCEQQNTPHDSSRISGTRTPR